MVVVMGSTEEADRFWKALDVTADRLTELEAVMKTRNEHMRESILSAVKEAMPSALLSEEEHTWVKMAIQKEAQSIALRRAIIEKSLAGLVWAGIVAFALVIREYAIAHGMWRA